MNKSISESVENFVEDPLWNIMQSSIEDSVRWYAIDNTRFTMTIRHIEESINDFVYFSVGKLNKELNDE
jgi:hypothetical protein